MPSHIKTVGVVGTGVIGASWTGLFLAQGLQVIVSDPGPGAEEHLSKYLEDIWPTMQGLELAPGASLRNYRFVGASMEKYYGEVDFIQENASERLELKIKLLGEIDAGARQDVIIASSSSGIPSSQFITECRKSPGRVLIGHPFNPPHLMPLVEVVPHRGSSKEAVTAALEIYRSLGKHPVHIQQETPGFAVNRIQAAVCGEAYSPVQRGIMSAADAWLNDMQTHKFDFTPANIAIVNDSVQEEVDMYDPIAVERQRDQLLIKLLKDKKSASAIM
ncbi:hypothetical protein LTR86_005838 [Recurvomyces mirabilis]|nr:hypothetical protein LTR86_005838 [Recurvomyces mirabilis]